MTVFQLRKTTVRRDVARSPECRAAAIDISTPTKAQWVIRESTYEQITPEFDETLDC